MKQFYRTYLFCLLAFLSSGAVVVSAQTILQDKAWGGANDIFDQPVGARALAMGGAYTAAADDPFALYWNPAALEKVKNMGLGLYYSNLTAGTQYSYLGYAHPTLFIGTFSIGVLTLSTPDIDLYDDQEPIKLGSVAYSRTLLMLGYGYRPINWLSLGATMKVERASLPAYPDAVTGSAGSLTESALGADLGLLLAPHSESPFLNQLSLAFSLQNAIQRSMRAVEAKDTTPRTMRLGLAKGVALGEDGSTMTLALEYDKASTMPGQSHLGLEYTFQDLFSLRTGFNRNHLTYGGGLKLAGVQFDYSYWNGDDAWLGSSHRISLILNIGRSREARLAEYQEREARRIEQELTAKRQAERTEAIVSGMSRARVLVGKGDYPGAYSVISRVLFYDVTGSDPDLEEARELLKQINTALEEERKREEAAILAKNEEEMRIKRNNLAIEQHYQRALNAYSLEDYPTAIRECDQALAIDPNSERATDLRRKSDEQLRRKIMQLAERARQLQAQDRGYDAITLYNQARQMAKGIPDIETFLSGQISSIESRLSREDLMRRAAAQELSQNWAEAASLYQEALRYDPGNRSLQDRYKEAKARAEARDMEMPENVRELYRLGAQAYAQHKYEEAVRHFEEARKLQPLNKKILKALDSAKENLQRQSATQGAQPK
ncbi:MAG TPA: PorV/PorQ family protein [bacterium]|nr:PorV/PorQ family protein [bacterium]HQG45731.1 PorV/PorQ family protein [bacterium]HQI47668.1 PorV/PorQ family protein [bacterium]HQJ63367.1 PorV/PorQ family protein [bacterium]